MYSEKKPVKRLLLEECHCRLVGHIALHYTRIIISLSAVILMLALAIITKVSIERAVRHVLDWLLL